jgi:hypothetical protein
MGHLAMHSRSLKTSTQNSLWWKIMGSFYSMLSAMLGGIGINYRIVGEDFFFVFW